MSRQRKKPAKQQGPHIIEFNQITTQEQTLIPRLKYVDIVPRNTKQEELLELINDNSNRVIFATGPAGVGKTILFSLVAIRELKRKNISRIIISRPAVSLEEDHGFLPGDLNKKMDPWVRPIMDILEEYYSPKEIQLMISERVLELSPLSYLRGRTFKNAIVILDEAQLTTPNQLKAFLTRIGDGCRLFITGDLRQSDKGKFGLNDFLLRLKTNEKPGIKLVEFSHVHIERDPIVKSILDIYGDQD